MSAPKSILFMKDFQGFRYRGRLFRSVAEHFNALNQVPSVPSIPVNNPPEGTCSHCKKSYADCVVWTYSGAAHNTIMRAINAS